MAKFERFEATVELNWDASSERTIVVSCKEHNVREVALEKAKKKFKVSNLRVIRYRKLDD